MALARRVGLIALFGALLWAPIAPQGHSGWPLALTQLLILVALASWLCEMARAGRFAWRPTALGLPLIFLVGVVVVQLALGSRPLTGWALGPAAAPSDFPSRLLTVGTVSSVQTWRSLGLFLTYLATYVLVVNLIRERRELVRLIRLLVALGGLLAFLGLLEYLVGEPWLLRGDAGTPVKRLVATFANPDHFGTWLAMVIALGIGLLAAGRWHGRETKSSGFFLVSREGREEAVRRYLPAIGVVIMALSLLFTLSRGAVISLIASVLVVLILFGAIGRARWSLVLVGGLSVVVAGYGSWIGLQPLLARFAEGQSRVAQAVSSLPMLSAFPTLGVGLGGYKDIYLRYQPAALGAGKVYFPFLHNDVLQLLIELGPLGAVLFAWAVWRGARDLVFAHLLGRGSCPVGGGEGELAQRHDPFSGGIAIGAVGAVVALLVHSLFDFTARIPANGLLGAACLGIATVAVHTRFDRSAHLLTEEKIWNLGTRASWAVCGALLLVGVVLVPFILRPALVEAVLPTGSKSASPEWITWAIRLDPSDPRVLALRAKQRADTGRRIWEKGLGGSDQPVPVALRQTQAVALLTDAVADLRSAIAATPTDPFFHEQLGLTLGALARVDAGRADEFVALATAHLKRAVALAPDNPFMHRSLAAFALTRPATLLPVAMEAARDAVGLDLDLLPELVDRFASVLRDKTQWLALTPEAWVPRLVLGSLLEARGGWREAEAAYRDAVVRAPAADVIGFWLLARLLMNSGQDRAAVAEADRALARTPGNPEIELVKAQALTSAGDPTALDVYRLAAQHSETAAQQPSRDPLPFKLAPPRRFELAPTSDAAHVRALVVARLGERVEPIRYQRALGQYLVDRRLWEQAGQALDVVLAETPKDAHTHFSRGRVWEGLGARDRAIESYRQAVALDARSEFRLALARLLWETEQYFQAMNEWRAILASAPGNVEALLGMAQAHLKEGDRLAAYHQYRRVLEIAPNNALARREIAKLTGAVR